MKIKVKHPCLLHLNNLGGFREIIIIGEETIILDRGRSKLVEINKLSPLSIMEVSYNSMTVKIKEFYETRDRSLYARKFNLNKDDEKCITRNY